MEQSPWEANCFSSSQEIPHILWNPKGYYCIHKCLPPLPILSQLDPVHTPYTPLSEDPLNIILLSTPGCPKWSLSLKFPHQNPVHASPLPLTRYMPSPFLSSRFYHPKSIGWGVQIIKLLMMYFSPLPCHFVPLRPKYSPQHPDLKHPQPTTLPQCERPCFTPIQNNRQNYSSLYLEFKILDSKLEDKRLCTEC